MAQIYGQLKAAALENLTSDPSSSTSGRLWFRTDLGQLKHDTGSVKSAFLLNDQKLIIGTSGTAGNNVRFNRAGTATLQLVTGSDATAEGSLSTNLGQFSSRLENYTFSGLPAAGNAGRQAWVTDKSLLYVDDGSNWKTISNAIETTDSTTTGSSQTLGAIGSTTVLRLTNASLVSINMIPAGFAGQKFILVNRTGATITLLRLNGGTATQQIETGSGSDLGLPNNTAIEMEYDNTTQKWQVVGITNTAGSGTSANIVTKTSNYTIQSTDSTIIGDATSGSFTLTLPSAASVANQKFIIKRKDSVLANTITISGTIGGATDWALYTIDEEIEIHSDGSVYNLTRHTCNTDWISVGNIVNYLTFTISTGSATIAATYTPTYVFTITAGNTASVGAIYSNNGHNYTLVQALLVGDTSLVVTGPADPTASGTLTYVSGTHTGGNITFSAFSGTNNIVTYTVAKTVASGTTLITQGSTTPPASGKLTKTGGTGDSIITYSAFSGSPNTITATTTAPVYYGSPITNAYKYKRVGREIVLWANFYQDTAGPTVGSGDYIWPTPSGINIDSTLGPTYTAGTPQSSTEFVESPVSNPYKLPGWGQADTATGYIHFYAAIPYSTTSYRMVGIYNVGTGIGVTQGSSFLGANAVMGFNWQATLPVQGWKP